MQTQTNAAINAIRHMSAPGVGNMYDPTTILKQWVMDKGYNLGTVKSLSQRGKFEDFVNEFLAAGNQNRPTPWNYFGARLHQTSGVDNGLLHAYNGCTEDNVNFMTAHTIFNGAEYFTGYGAAAKSTRGNFRVPNNIQRVRIAVVGGGAAGIMTTYSLIAAGFESTVLISPKHLGIWDQKNVYEGSRNNPRRLEFGNQRLDAAPGDGAHVRSFLEELFYSVRRESRVFDEKVASIKAGNLKHTLVLTGGSTHHFDIVINTMGTGAPASLNDPAKMMVVGEEVRGAVRWQKVGLTGKDVAGKRFIFVGLGNSTAEMIRQLHELMDEGYETDYRILTHYPKDAVANPSTTVHHKGRNYRVFRDLSTPDLTGFQGDLEKSRRDYFRALVGGKIISGATRWGVKEREGGKVFAYGTNVKNMTEIGFDHLYVLTGYKHAQADLEKFSCSFDEDNQAVRYDYDGEVVADPTKTGPDRLHRGYFVLGAIADAPHNRNAVVIPGMISGIPPLIAGVIMRAGEVALQNN